MDKETLKYILAQSITRPLPPATPRAMTLPLESGKVVALVGIRRSGKTYLLYETMRRLEAKGVDRQVVRELVEQKGPKVLAELPGRGQGWTLHYAVFARRGFTAEAHSEAARHGAILIDAAQLDADLR